MSFLTKLFSGEKNALEIFQKEVNLVNSFSEEIAALSQEHMRQEITNFKLQILKLETNEEIKKGLWEIAPRVFALVREATKRTIYKPHFDVQIAGGFVLAK